MSRRREHGIALVAAATALAVLGVLAVGLAHTTAVDERLTRNALMALQADALARSGVAVASVVLGEVNAAGAPDTLRSPWAADVGRQPLGAGWIEVRIEDEARRLPLNAPELADAVPRLLGALGLDPTLADAIADWTDADDVPRPHGGERSWYLGERPPRVPRNGPLASVAELALVRGFDARALARLAPHVTVAGEHAVDPNTASPEVLLAVVGNAAAVDRLLAARARAPIGDDDVDALLGDAAARPLLVTRAQYYAVRVVSGVGEIRRGVEATVWAPAGVAPTVVAWRPFTPDAGASPGTWR